jgi:hypothetical protein
MIGAPPETWPWKALRFSAVSRISTFYGIMITMYWEVGGRHQTPHFHARYGEHEASIAIEHLAVLAGDLPPKALGLVFEWASLYRLELTANWQRVQRHESLVPIPPLP